MMTENLEDMKQKFLAKVTNQFVVYGNINDYIRHNGTYTSLKEYLFVWLKEIGMDIIVYYDIAVGLQFPDASYRETFENLLSSSSNDSTYKEYLSPEQAEELEKEIKELERNTDDQPDNLALSPQKAFALIEKATKSTYEDSEGNKQKVRLALIVEFAETIAPAEAGGLSDNDRINIVALRRLAQEHIAQQSIIILITKDIADLHPSLRGRGTRVKTIEIPLPEKQERISFVRRIISSLHQSELSEEQIAHNTGGLTLKEIEDIHKQSKKITLEIISKEKAKYLEAEFGDVLQIIHPRWGLDNGIGGLEHIKEYFREIKEALILGDPRLVPPAIILMGPPGTGKTAIAEALAYEWGVPFVEILNLRSMWVGESERIALKVMTGLQSLAPCVVFWDEFDQEEAPRGSYQGDSGVSARLRKIRFQITSDPKNRGKFLIIYATNRPDLLDIADKRSGRGSVRIPMILPEAEERAQIFAIMPKRYQFQTEVADFKPIVEYLTELHGEFTTGADIEEISLLAYRRSCVKQHEVVRMDDYFYACAEFVPHPYNQSLIKQMEQIAILERSSNRFLSERGRKIIASIQKGRS